MSLCVFVTGGTFDKEYNEIDGSLYFRSTHVGDLLALGRCRLTVKVRTLMMIDSLEMTEADRKIILDNCRSCPEDRIIVTHGTDTMVETAALLGRNLTDKTVVMTGAMIPIAFGSSDGLFNMGCALAFAQSLPHGIYIAMGGRYFRWDNVRKNRKLGQFEELDQ